jgi:hypothetical protein
LRDLGGVFFTYASAIRYVQVDVAGCFFGRCK